MIIDIENSLHCCCFCFLQSGTLIKYGLYGCWVLDRIEYFSYSHGYTMILHQNQLCRSWFHSRTHTNVCVQVLVIIVWLYKMRTHTLVIFSFTDHFLYFTKYSKRESETAIARINIDWFTVYLLRESLLL